VADGAGGTFSDGAVACGALQPAGGPTANAAGVDTVDTIAMVKARADDFNNLVITILLLSTIRVGT
jgi:hypothetical protein